MARPFTLAVFTKNRVNPAYAAARLAADRVAAEAGARTLHFVPQTPDDVGQQKALVGEALAAVPDAVVFVPVDDRQMVPDLARFADAGIPVVTCINRMEGKVISFVGSDDVAVGHTAAKALFGALPAGGRIVAIEGTPAAPTSRDRTVGLGKALAETPAMELVGSGVGYFQQAPAREEMARLLAEHAEIDGVWTSNDVMAFGVLEALAAAGRPAKVVGVNGLPEAIDNIERGTMQASVDFSAFNIAGIAARAALRHLRGEAVPASIMVPAALIDGTNFQRWKVPFALRPTPVWEEIVA
ncbi:ribose transport system substrate-binding protein [Rhodospirillales bacterium URHD0017]|nr:ribose transport system substrate-binding protein [Rhodospirillales bacterium URHD0017]